MPDDTIRERLRDLRERKGASQDAVAEACGLSRVALTRYENGTRAPRLDIAARLAAYYGVTVDYILGRDPVEAPAESPEPLVTVTQPDAKRADLSGVDFGDPEVQAKLLKPGHNYPPETAAVYAEIIAKLRRLTPEQLTQADAFVSFLENQQKE